MSAIPEPVVVEARAKIIWGESTQKVLTYLQSKSVGDKEASVLLEDLMKERAASIRTDGVKKVWIGVLFVLAPVAYYLVSKFVGFWSLKLFSGLIVLGIVGIAKLSSGLSMILKPRAVKGDLSNAGI
jgi:hypothetical protein